MNPVLAVRELRVVFPVSRRRQVLALDSVGIDLAVTESLGIVGESGCGKTTLARAILGLVKIDGGEIQYCGKNVRTLSSPDRRSYRKNIQIVFQDYNHALDPKMTVEESISEPQLAFGLCAREQARERTRQLMESVHISASMGGRLPHEFSGGERQRLCLARALAVRPEVLIADEPVSSLDTSVQGHVLQLLGKLREEFGLSLVFISHDLVAVRLLTSRMVVMYLGRIVETGPTNQLYARPWMPYTRALVSSVLPEVGQPVNRSALAHFADAPSLLATPSGCAFRSRCPFAIPECSRLKPRLREVAPGRSVACLRVGPLEPDISVAAAKKLGVQDGSAEP